MYMNKKNLPKLRILSKENKKHIYKLYDTQKKRILAIEEGINQKKNKTTKNKRDAAKMKKARFNILRLYRKNNDKKGCKNLTKDMIYLDKKYNLGKTKNICKGGSRYKKTKKLKKQNIKIAYFSAGCFWGVQEKFNKVNGVIKTNVGYMGGKLKNPSYEEVSTGETGHAESIQVIYDSNTVNYKDLLLLFFTIHDPTTLNKQGPDIGNQYRSIIFYSNKKEKKVILDFISYLVNKRDIVTQILSTKKFKFYKAESYHQNYLKNKKGGYKKKTNKYKKQQFLYNPNDPKRSFDVYIDKDPTDTISIKYSNVNDVKKTIGKLERLYKTKKYPHKRIWQVGMIMKVRMEAMLKHKKTRYKKAKNVRERYNLTKKYFKFLGKRSKAKTFKERKQMTFKL